MGSSSLVQPTPGDPREPASGEPTIMAFRRPPDRPLSGGGKTPPAHSQSLRAAESLPVVLRLPELARSQAAPPPVAPIGSTRPWIGIAMWCATGALAVVAAILILTGKPESPPTTDEAPQWQPGSAATGSTDHSADIGHAGGAPDANRPVGGTFGSPVVDATSRQTVDGAGVAQPGLPPWRRHESAGQPPAAARLPSDTAPTGGLPPTTAPGDMSSGGSIPGNAAPSGIVPGGGDPAGGQRQPTADPSVPSGMNGEWPPTDPSKLQSDVRSAVRPNTARLGGGIQNLKTGPTTR